jgi:hypothetical protein
MAPKFASDIELIRAEAIDAILRHPVMGSDAAGKHAVRRALELQ